MARVCSVCGKKTTTGNTYTRRGLAKKKGGNGQNVTGKTKRTFRPNLQRIRVWQNGTVMRQQVCTSCIRNGKVTKPPKMKQRLDELAEQGKIKKRAATTA